MNTIDTRGGRETGPVAADGELSKDEYRHWSDISIGFVDKNWVEGRHMQNTAKVCRRLI